jgi:hypothetical protein
MSNINDIKTYRLKLLTAKKKKWSYYLLKNLSFLLRASTYIYSMPNHALSLYCKFAPFLLLYIKMSYDLWGKESQIC